MPGNTTPINPTTPPRPTPLDLAVHEFCVESETPWILNPIDPEDFKASGLDLLKFRAPGYDPIKKQTDVEQFSSDLDSYLVGTVRCTRKSLSPQEAREKIRILVNSEPAGTHMQTLLTFVDNNYAMP